MIHFSLADLHSVRFKRMAIIAVTLLTAGVLYGWNTFADESWSWRDLTSQLPPSFQNTFTIGASRGTDWMVSNGDNLFHVKADGASNISQDLANRGRVLDLASDGTSYLLATQSPLNTGAKLWLTKGERFEAVNTLGTSLQTRTLLTGWRGQWGVMTTDLPQVTSLPASWQLYQWMEGTDSLERLPFPNEASAFVPGCVQPATNQWICNGATRLVALPQGLFLFASKAESRNQDDVISEEGRAFVWRWHQGKWQRVTTSPETKFWSHVWIDQGRVLLASSNAVTTPYAADDLWLFDGRTFRSIRTHAARAGLLSGTDARNLKAAWVNNHWIVNQGKSFFSVDEDGVSLAGQSRDTVRVLLGGKNGYALVAGEKGSFEAGNPGEKTPTIATIMVNASEVGYDTTALFRQSAEADRNRAATIRVVTSPGPTTIANGTSYIYRAEATDPDGIDRLEIWVNGAPIVRCTSSPCEWRESLFTDIPWREITLQAQVIDRKGQYTATDETIVRIDRQVAPTSLPTDIANLVPGNLFFSTDFGNGIKRAIWQSPNLSQLGNNDRVTIGAAGIHPKGIRTIEFWVNGTMTHRCDFFEGTVTRYCFATIDATNFSAGSEIFANARIVSTESKETWTEGLRWNRVATSTAPTTPTAPSATSSLPTTFVNPAIEISPWLDPFSPIFKLNEQKIWRVAAVSQLGINKITLYRDGTAVKTCDYAGRETRQECSVSISANDLRNISVLQAVAYDKTGARNTSPVIPVTINSNLSLSDLEQLRETAWTVSQNGRLRFIAHLPRPDVQFIEMHVGGEVRGVCQAVNGCNIHLESNKIAEAFLLLSDGSRLWSGFARQR